MVEGGSCVVMGLRAEDGVQRYWCWSFEEGAEALKYDKAKDKWR